MSRQQSSDTPPEGWPRCESGPVEVMLLGTYHMDNPGLDVAQLDVDDVLHPERQAQLRTTVDALEGWRPDRVAVERPYDRADEVNAIYDEYRSGKRSYDAEEEIEPPHPSRNELTTECRSEVVQLGFRLADRLDHERVFPIDYPMTLANEAYEELAEDGFEPEEKIQFDQLDVSELEREVTEQIATSSIQEFLLWQNRERNLGVQSAGFFGESLRWGRENNFGGPKLVATWYDRNLRMVHNLWRAIESEDERVLVVVGAGHVHILRELLEKTPMFCPVSPLPSLEEAM
ncbi:MULTISPECIES: DUF5694 domain-containing protein [Haloferax]|uniref:Uncharacterized protein n=1 Tax=Haloferax marinum TaxID=2666143 RepID=A0A6A8G5C9_9EURY|nr:MULTISPECIES: DUF5694 domain-containing protein [Haloferax]KAB1196965.1 hypothetical protein Hfx1150_05280 [Haloferax sp. CBA1150]MRW95985.1 hypothetical protein [Haloferax marinum]